VQLLWINILTDSFPALALGVEPVDSDAMTKPPRKLSDKIIDKPYLYDMLFTGGIMAAGTLFVFYISLPLGGRYATTMAFSTLVVFQLFNVLNCKSEHSILKTGVLNNPRLLLAIAVSLSLQFIVVYAPFVFETIGLGHFNLGAQLGTTALSFQSWLVVFGVGSTVFIFEEIKKFANGRT